MDSLVTGYKPTNPRPFGWTLGLAAQQPRSPQGLPTPVPSSTTVPSSAGGGTRTDKWATEGTGTNTTRIADKLRPR